MPLTAEAVLDRIDQMCPKDGGIASAQGNSADPMSTAQILVLANDVPQVRERLGNRTGAQARSLASNREYVLPIRFHRDVKVPGLLETVGYLDADQYDLDTIATLAMGKLQNLQN